MILFNVTGGLLVIACWSWAAYRKSVPMACVAALPTAIMIYRVLEHHTGWATMLLSVLLLGLGAAASVHKAGTSKKSAA